MTTEVIEDRIVPADDVECMTLQMLIGNGDSIQGIIGRAVGEFSFDLVGVEAEPVICDESQSFVSRLGRVSQPSELVYLINSAFWRLNACLPDSFYPNGVPPVTSTLLNQRENVGKTACRQAITPCDGRDRTINEFGSITSKPGDSVRSLSLSIRHKDAKIWMVRAWANSDVRDPEDPVSFWKSDMQQLFKADSNGDIVCNELFGRIDEMLHLYENVIPVGNSSSTYAELRDADLIDHSTGRPLDDWAQRVMDGHSQLWADRALQD